MEEIISSIVKNNLAEICENFFYFRVNIRAFSLLIYYSSSIKTSNANLGLTLVVESKS